VICVPHILVFETPSKLFEGLNKDFVDMYGEHSIKMGIEMYSTAIQ